MGIGANTLTNQYQGLIFKKIDSLGNQLTEKQIFHPLGKSFYANSSSNAFIKLDSTKALFTGQLEFGTDYSKSTLVKINLKTLDTLWMKTYSQPGDSTWLLCSTVLNDSSIISFGFRYYIVQPNVFFKPFMMKVDKNGNYKWHNWINPTFTNTQYLFQKAIKLSDNDFVVVGYKYSNICYPQSFVMRIDTMASKAYDVNFIGIPNSGLADCIALSDGSFLAGGSFASLVNCNANPDKYRKYVYRFNPLTGSKIASKFYNKESTGGNGILCLAQKLNGIIIAFGGTGATTPTNTINNKGDFLWLNSNLDSLRSVYIETPNVADQAVPNQAILTPDGGFAAVIASYPNASQQQYWLIKADSNGCYQSLCPTVGLNDVSLSGVENGIKIYPNPAKDLLYVENSHAERSRSVTSETRTSFSLTNALGQVIKEELLLELQQPIEINVKDLQEGIYFLQIKSEGKILVNKKFVIER
ncbi:MAG: T9SS type A sorting domain-containing protein [Bacteroidetes bacterium]|nr:T9SS type A sorting domain-containing protein [Bacteroidota bacterium]MCA6444371.1 T9SS type A sorting domain-containing protein [Bacteroidota bacterium]